MKTLYVSDLDGTLLRSDAALSRYTCEAIGRLTAAGMLFSYATARSYVTASKVTKGLDAKIPLIVYNGAFIVNNVTGKTLRANFFGEDGQALLRDLIAHGVYPVVYAVAEGKERFSYLPQKCTKETLAFTATRSGDPRDNPVGEAEELFLGEIFYFTCIGEAEKLTPLFQKYQHRYHCVFQKDVYTGDLWLEIMPQAASKANAVCQLKELLGCSRVVAFGDGKNDLDMFEVADEGYAVANAVDELQRAAVAVIGSNDEDGVARWLEQHGRFSAF
ncbi:MAG: HAD family hydrolase [Oscillospiraceae bacterium]|jgi:Cof subfamily protein (haloacid dehalogenase superfamily)|nr:HAD family hydrolase [Oscillospiraceae bacterium]